MSIKLWLASCSVSSKSLGFFFFHFFWQNCSLIINNFSCQSATSPICSFVEIDLSFCLPEEGGFRFIILIYLTQDSFYSRSPPPTHTHNKVVCVWWVGSPSGAELGHQRGPHCPSPSLDCIATSAAVRWRTRVPVRGVWGCVSGVFP